MKYIVHIIIAILCFTIGLFACVVFKTKLISPPPANPLFVGLDYKDSLKVRVLQAGDTIAYKKLKEVMSEEGFPHRIWFYSMVMTKQYHYSLASYDVYNCVNYVYNQQFEKRAIDPETQKLISLFLSEDSVHENRGGTLPFEK